MMKFGKNFLASANPPKVHPASTGADERRARSGRNAAGSETAMRKSNSKEARRAVEKYVLEALEPINERARFDGKYDPARPVTSAFNVLTHELAWQSTSDRHGSGLEIMGADLAKSYRAAGRHDHISADNPYRVWQLYILIGSVAAYTSDQREAVASWMDQTPEQAERYSADKVEAQYCHMSAAAFERLYERENTPHRISTAEFIELFQRKNGGHFFDRDTLAYWGQTRRSFTVYAFELVTDYTGTVRDCYAVYHTITSPTGERFPKVNYFERDTLAEVFTGSDNA